MKDVFGLVSLLHLLNHLHLHPMVIRYDFLLLPIQKDPRALTHDESNLPEFLRYRTSLFYQTLYGNININLVRCDN